jgi:hypothetical protein
MLDRIRRGVEGVFRVLVATLAVIVAVTAVAEFISFLVFAGNIIPGESARHAAERGLLLVYAFHHVGMEIQTPGLTLPRGAETPLALPSGDVTNASLAFAFMLGTLITVWILYRAGRALGRRFGGSPVRRGLLGATIAIPYAGIAASLSWLLKIPQRFPNTSPLVITPTHRGSLLWPLFFAGITCFIGGFRSTPSDEAHDWLELRLTGKSIRFWRGALAGAKRTLVLGLVLAFIGLMVLAPLHSKNTSAYFKATGARGVRGQAATVALTLAAAPNMAVWVLVPAMGGCIEVGGGASQTNPPPPYCFLSYSHALSQPLPELDDDWSFAGYHDLGPLPRGYLLFLLVPLAASFLGGFRAVRIARPETTRETLLVTSLAGVVFALEMVVVSTLAWITLWIYGVRLLQSDYIRYGPYPPYVFQLSLSWAVVIGGLGGLLAKRTARSQGNQIPQSALSPS